MIDPEKIKRDLNDAFLKSPVFFNDDFIIPAHHYRYLEYKDNNYKDFPGSYLENDGVLYEYNSDGHRSDEFKKDHVGKHILFAGCSETFGANSSAETTWPYMLYEKINKIEKTSGFFRLGFPGGGFQLILKGIMNYINVYGKPDELFIMFPHLERRIEFKDFSFINVVHAPMTSPKKIDDRYRYSMEEYAMWFFEVKERMILFESYCKSNNINLYWSFFMDGINEICAKITEFSNYVVMENSEVVNKKIFNTYSKEDLNKKDMLVRSDGHAGIAKHSYWANKMWEARNEYYQQN